MGIKFEASDNVGNAATSVYYSLWIDGTAPAFGVFAPTVWVKSGTAATMAITVRRERKRRRIGRDGRKERIWREERGRTLEQDTGSGTSTATVYYELTTDGTTFGSWASATCTGGWRRQG